MTGMKYFSCMPRVTLITSNISKAATTLLTPSDTKEANGMKDLTVVVMAMSLAVKRALYC
jgi:hypothetical protein